MQVRDRMSSLEATTTSSDVFDISSTSSLLRSIYPRPMMLLVPGRTSLQQNVIWVWPLSVIQDDPEPQPQPQPGRSCDCCYQCSADWSIRSHERWR